MNRITISAVLLSAFAALAGDYKKESIHMSPDELKWESPNGEQGPQVANASGDAKKGPNAVFMKFPAGFDSGWHTHNGWYTATVVKGTVTAQAQGEAAPKELPVGSFFAEPAKKNHRNTCTKDGECIVFGYQEKGNTFNPMDEAGKPVKPDAAKKDAPKAEEKK